MNSIFSFSNIVSEFKTSIRLALPLIAAELIYALNGFIATVMIAHLGKEQLAANALVWGIYLAVILFFMGIFSSVSIMVAQSFGAKDSHGVSICFKQGLIMAIIFSVPMMFIMWLSPIVLVWTKQDPIVIAYAKPFFHALIWPMLPLNIIVVMQQFLASLSKTKMVMVMSILTVPIEIFFYYAFLFGHFGLPKLGLAGIGYGLTVTDFIIVIFFAGYFHFANDLRVYHLFKKFWVINREFLLEMIRIGLPLGFMFCLELALFAAIAIMMGTLGATTLAAYQITYQYLMIGLTVIFALTQTVMIRVGNEVGGNNRAALKLTAVVNMGISLCFTLILGTLYICFPGLAIGIDINIHDPNLQSLVNEATICLSIVSVLIVTECLRLISVGALRGLKDTKFSLMISIIGFWCTAFPTAYLLAFKYKLGGAGIWWGLVFGLCLAGITLFIRFNYLAKRIDLAALVTKSGAT